MKKRKSLMFSFITTTWNPVTGCRHKCKYCWAENLADTKLKHLQRYRTGFIPLLHPSELLKKFKPGDFVFVVDMGDLFGWWVPDPWIELVFSVIRSNPKVDFLLLTKNPARMLTLEIPENAVVGATIETDQYIVSKITNAPPPIQRFSALAQINHKRKLLVMEPIMNFNLSNTTNEIFAIPDLKPPSKIVIGYDNYWRRNRLPEPALWKTKKLIQILRENGYDVETKTLREAWDE